VLEAGSFVYPTHVYNLCRFSNSSVANHFGCDTFWQGGGDTSQHCIGGKPMLNLGGRFIFWSGLIPTIQGWELEFFPPRVRQDLSGGLLNSAGGLMNESRSMGSTARAVVEQLRQTPLAADFSIQETPRALHQPYLMPDGTPKDRFFTEPTGVFNTAELLINQLGLTPGVSHGDGTGMQLLLNHYVEDVQNHGEHFELVCRNTLTNQIRVFRAVTVVLAAGSIESPKLLRCRYVSRPPVAVERLALTPSGQVRYTLKTPYRDGTTHIVLEPLDLMARLAALVPPPRMHLTRFHGVFAPHSKLRAAVTPAHRGVGSKTAPANPAQPITPRHVAMTWAQRLKRVFGVEINTCARCGGKLKVIASIEEPEVIAKILAYLEKTAPDQHQAELPLGARAPPTQARLM
jgi:hypothetical protein